MNDKQFWKIAKQMVVDYANEQGKNDEPVLASDVIVVWWCKTLQNAKAMMITGHHDHAYYEVTYNGDKHEFYFDAYNKRENICFREAPTGLWVEAEES